MHVRDRIRELRRVRAADLAPNPKNWRVHPEAQRNALRGILAEIGFADALLARELPDGRLLLIDGHLRAETTPEQQVPVLVLDLNEAEADRLLATLDPLCAMADNDHEALSRLVNEVDFESEAVRSMLAELTAGLKQAAETAVDVGSQAEAFQRRLSILIECRDEDQQRELLERFHNEGLTCRALIA
jgi:hypothetical protein